jgi:hypothetical protein
MQAFSGIIINDFSAYLSRISQMMMMESVSYCRNKHIFQV